MDVKSGGFSEVPLAFGHISELAVVALTRTIHIDNKPLPAGSKGTVVAAYDDGLGYEVEFEAPFHAVVTLEASDLMA
jgi:hypothetical protein